ncbi:MAG: hypothetical protein CMJ36_05980 [Phycisphaerae bacterium]|nr:hypothetical protein [Phycisphaerae bacterium]
MGDLLGLDYEIVGVNHITGANAPVGDHYTVDIFAVVEAGDRLDAVAGDDNVDKVVSALPNGSFWQSSYGGNDSTYINPDLFNVFPSVEFDSFVTIGLLDQNGNAMSTQGIDFSQFEVGGDIFADNGAWYVTPADPQGESEAFTGTDCSDGFAVRVARLTVNGLGTSVHLEALFQGKDSGGVTWTTNGSIDVNYAPIVDCNGNGVADDCDIANGDSSDANENEIPDECETIDCNNNGINDADDIADGTSTDCNGNNVPDECDIADGTSTDCNGNGLPDECESDCNGNNIPDECDIADGTSEDCNGNEVPDECDPDEDGDGLADGCYHNYFNLNTWHHYDTFAEAIIHAHDGDTIHGLAEAVNQEPSLDFNGKCIHFSVVEGTLQSPAWSTTTLSGCATVFNVKDFFGPVRSGVSGTSRLVGWDSGSEEGDDEDEDGIPDNCITFSDITVRQGATLEVDHPLHSYVTGTTILRHDSVLSHHGSTDLHGWRFLTQHCHMGPNSTIEGGVRLQLNGTGDGGGTLNAQGHLIGDTDNQHRMNVINDLVQIGHLRNAASGIITIHRGTFHLVGDLDDFGTIHGDIDTGPGDGLLGGDETQPGDGFSVNGSYTAGPDASLTMPHEFWAIRIGGHVNLEINDPGTFHMSLAELHATGRADGVQDIEVMGTNLGNTEDGLEQGAAGNFPLGTLRIDASSSARLVDVHDNDSLGQDAGEAFYCDTLVVDGYLDTNGFKVYANNVVINGKVSDVLDVIIINPPVLGDLNGDSLVDVLDLLVVIAEWGSCPGECGAADLNGDGVVDVLDLLIILQEWS